MLGFLCLFEVPFCILWSCYHIPVLSKSDAHDRFTRILKSWFYGTSSIGLWRWDVIAGLVTGFSTSLISFSLVGFLRPLMAFICRFCAVRELPHSPSTILLKRACLFALYVSIMSWVTIQYIKRLGFL